MLCLGAVRFPSNFCSLHNDRVIEFDHQRRNTEVEPVGSKYEEWEEPDTWVDRGSLMWNWREMKKKHMFRKFRLLMSNMHFCYKSISHRQKSINYVYIVCGKKRISSAWSHVVNRRETPPYSLFNKNVYCQTSN